MGANKKKLEINDRYLQKLDRILIRLHKDGSDGLTKEQVEDAADAAGQSINAYILDAVRERMQR